MVIDRRLLRNFASEQSELHSLRTKLRNLRSCAQIYANIGGICVCCSSFHSYRCELHSCLQQNTKTSSFVCFVSGRPTTEFEYLRRRNKNFQASFHDCARICHLLDAKFSNYHNGPYITRHHPPKTKDFALHIPQLSKRGLKPSNIRRHESFLQSRI